MKSLLMALMCVFAVLLGVEVAEAKSCDFSLYKGLSVSQGVMDQGFSVRFWELKRIVVFEPQTEAVYSKGSWTMAHLPVGTCVDMGWDSEEPAVQSGVAESVASSEVALSQDWSRATVIVTMTPARPVATSVAKATSKAVAPVVVEAGSMTTPLPATKFAARFYFSVPFFLFILLSAFILCFVFIIRPHLFFRIRPAPSPPSALSSLSAFLAEERHTIRRAS